MQNFSDSKLVSLTMAGNREAFGCLLNRYQPLAIRAAARLIGDSEVACELAQEAAIQAYLSLDRLLNPAYFKSWFIGITLNLSRSYLRRAASHPTLSLERILDSPAAELDRLSSWHFLEMFEQRELQRQVSDAVRQLPEHERLVIILFYFQQLSLQEIATKLSLTNSAVKVRLHRARKNLKKLLRDRQPVAAKQINWRNLKMRKVTIVDVVMQNQSEPLVLPPQPGEGQTDVLKVRQPHCAVALLDPEGRRLLHIWIGETEGESIAIGLRDFNMPRPLTHNFVAKIIETLGASLTQVNISSLNDSVYYATAVINSGETTHEIDCRPSDALALAVRTGSPVFVHEDVLDKAGIPIPPEVNLAHTSGRGISQILQMTAERNQKILSFVAGPEEDQQKTTQDLIDFVFGEES